jgi:hypothetical protein
MWFGLTLQANSSIQCKIYYAKNATVGSGHTFTFDGTAVYPSIGIMAFSGSDTTSPFDQENGAENAGTTSLQTGSVTPSTNAQILVAALGFNTANTISVNSSFTGLIQQNFTGGVEGMAMAYLIQTTAGAVNPTFSWSSSSAAAAAIATFKTAAAGGFSPGWANRSTSGIAGSGVS